MFETAPYIRHPFLLAEGLNIAAEVTEAKMTAEQSGRLSRLIDKLKHGGTIEQRAFDSGSLLDLLHCIDLFRQSRTWHWLRSDLVDALSEFERAVRKAQSVK